MIFVHGLTEKGEILNCSEVNDVACRQLGYERKKLHSISLLDVTAEEHRTETAREMKNLLTQNRLTFETVLVTCDDKRIPVEISATVFTLGGRKLVLSLARDISERRETERTIAEAGERDRRLLGHELHDVMCQDLTSITMLASVLQNTLAAEKNDKVMTDLDMIHDMAKRGVTFSKRLCAGLFPVELDSEGLDTALEQLAHNQEHLFNIPCQFRCNPQAVPTDKSIALHVYRIAQEAVTNAMKHSAAKRVSIVLDKKEDRNVLIIEDDGKGFPSDQESAQGIGLHIMRYRVRMMGGAFKISDRNGGGTTITCSWP
jgi:two-component system CheB/CheR fusion protein